MDFFDKLGKKATEAYKITADKTGKLAKETKLKLKMGELKSQIKDIYEEIGKKVYENHIREEKIDLNNVLEEQCTKIDVLSDEIDTLLKECLDLKDKKQCKKCFTEIAKEAKFCPICGEKQEELVKEVEVIENKQEENNETENEKTNLEKTVEVEIGVESENVSNKTAENLETTVEIESDADLKKESKE